MPTAPKKKSARRSTPFVAIAAFALLAIGGAVALPLQAQLLKVFSVATQQPVAMTQQTSSVPTMPAPSMAEQCRGTDCWAPLKSNRCVKVPVFLGPNTNCLSYGLVEYEAQCMEALQRQ